MIKKILSFFYTDLQWKLMSLLLAVVIWLVAMHLHDPMVNHSLPRNLHIENLQTLERDGLVLLNEYELRDTNINLGIRGNRSAISELTTENLAYFNVYVDMRAVNSALAHQNPVPAHY